MISSKVAAATNRQFFDIVHYFRVYRRNDITEQDKSNKITIIA